MKLSPGKNAKEFMPIMNETSAVYGLQKMHKNNQKLLGEI